METRDYSVQTRTIDYADPRLPTGSAGYRRLEYPSDRAGFWNPAHVTDDGEILKLEPGPLRWRFIGVCFVTVGCIAMILLMSNEETAHPGAPPAIRILLSVVFFVAVLIVPGIFAFWHRRRTPWVIVDRRKKSISLPRAHKSISFQNVVRLQFVSFVPVGFSTRTLSYRDKPDSG